MPPGWDGLETIDRLWQVDPQLQIVMCNAYTDYSWKEIQQRFGQTSNLLILKKPFDISDIAQMAAALNSYRTNVNTQTSVLKLNRITEKIDSGVQLSTGKMLG